MIDLIIRVRVKDNIEAYKVVSRLSFEHEIKEATYEGKRYVFSEEDKVRAPRRFLAGNFNKNNEQ